MVLLGLWKFLLNLFHLVFYVDLVAVHLSVCFRVLKLAFVEAFAFGSVFKIFLSFSFGVDFWGFWAFFNVELFALLETVSENGAVLLMGFFVDFFNMLKVLFVFLYFLFDVAFLKLLGLFGFERELLDFDFSFSFKVLFYLFDSFSFLGFLVFFLEEIIDLILKNRIDFFLLLIVEVIFVVKLDEFVVVLDFLFSILGHGLE